MTHFLYKVIPRGQGTKGSTDDRTFGAGEKLNRDRNSFGLCVISCVVIITRYICTRSSYKKYKPDQTQVVPLSGLTLVRMALVEKSSIFKNKSIFEMEHFYKKKWVLKIRMDNLWPSTSPINSIIPLINAIPLNPLILKSHPMIQEKPTGLFYPLTQPMTHKT